MVPATCFFVFDRTDNKWGLDWNIKFVSFGASYIFIRIYRMTKIGIKKSGILKSKGMVVVRVCLL